jgi:hypothetical protein
VSCFPAYDPRCYCTTCNQHILTKNIGVPLGIAPLRISMRVGPSGEGLGIALVCISMGDYMTTTLETRNLFRTYHHTGPCQNLALQVWSCLEAFMRKFQDPPNHGPSPTSWYHVEAIRSLFQQRALVSLGLHLCVLVRNLF